MHHIANLNAPLKTYSNGASLRLFSAHSKPILKSRAFPRSYPCLQASIAQAPVPRRNLSSLSSSPLSCPRPLIVPPQHRPFGSSSRAFHGLSSSSSHRAVPYQYPPSRILLPTILIPISNSRSFHASRRVQGHPILVILLPLLKSSASLGLIKTVARITLSLLPVFWIKKFKIVAWLRRNMSRKEVDELFPQKKAIALNHLKIINKLIWATLFIPGFLMLLIIGASLERTPLTGRWRLITLSPAEEEEIADELRGSGWYKAILEILTNDSPDGKTPPRIVPRSDWRYQWVEQTLRRLEASILVMNDHRNLSELFDRMRLEVASLPPPPEYPLLPRPRASQVLHSIPLSDDHHGPHSADQPHTHHHSPHTLLGPPYSLLIIENPDRNAFSYGFGADGSGGIVLYTGFLDEVLSLTCTEHPTTSQQPQSSSSFLGSFFGGQSVSRPPSPAPKTPSSLQTSALATLLSHELSHLVLSHHLETLSSGQFIPLVTGIVLDFARVVIFPFTFIFGPFISDALADASRLGMRELSRASEACASRELELEADRVSLRLMALAGFDPHRTIAFWEDRLNDTWALDADAVRHSGAMPTASFWSPHAGSADANVLGPSGERPAGSHPLGSERVRRLRKELENWEEERERLKRMQQEAESAAALG